ncbi:MAG TPA: ferredoxin [Actinophytocola sp.]|jgi:ferredoxin|uniref:ferredoxin n=1 Tax=Actinophytocola sp. TaxID=1872138 RepID=UPI002E0B7FEE|nr:ferredoxin [Actinophytocola sp.]
MSRHGSWRTRNHSGPQLSVNNDRCKRYGTCQAEAPELFQLMITGELRYRRSVPPDQLEQAKTATRHCPMLAIVLKGVVDER